MGMSAAFAQESMPDDGVDDDAALGSAYHNTRDDLSEVSMDDSVLGDGDDGDDCWVMVMMAMLGDGDEEGGRRQCCLGMTFRNSDGKGGGYPFFFRIARKIWENPISLGAFTQSNSPLAGGVVKLLMHEALRY